MCQFPHLHGNLRLQQIEPSGRALLIATILPPLQNLRDSGLSLWQEDDLPLVPDSPLELKEQSMMPQPSYPRTSLKATCRMSRRGGEKRPWDPCKFTPSSLANMNWFQGAVTRKGPNSVIARNVCPMLVAEPRTQPSPSAQKESPGPHLL